MYVRSKDRDCSLFLGLVGDDIFFAMASIARTSYLVVFVN